MARPLELQCMEVTMSEAEPILALALCLISACGPRENAHDRVVPGSPALAVASVQTGADEARAGKGPPQAGACNVKATGQDIVLEGEFNADATRGKVATGMTPAQVMEVLGAPKKIECGGNPVK
jgi:hypothetical protein